MPRLQLTCRPYTAIGVRKLFAAQGMTIKKDAANIFQQLLLRDLQHIITVSKSLANAAQQKSVHRTDIEKAIFWLQKQPK